MWNWFSITSQKLSSWSTGKHHRLITFWLLEVSVISSCISSPPRGRFLSFWHLTSTLPGEHRGWEFVKTPWETAAAFVSKFLLEAPLNFSVTSCSFCAWKISSSFTFPAISFSPFSFALQSSPTWCSASFYDLLILPLELHLRSPLTQTFLKLFWVVEFSSWFKK